MRCAVGPEAKVQKAVIAHARLEGMLAIKLTMSGPLGVKGWPDFMILWKVLNGKSGIAFIEFKAPGKEPTALQLQKHAQMKDRGFIVNVVDDIEAGKALINSWLEMR